MDALIRFYSRIPPIITATAETTAISVFSVLAGDGITAWRHKHSYTVDPTEMLRFLAFVVICCPIEYLWEIWLERTWPARKHGATLYAKLPTSSTTAAISPRASQDIELEDRGGGGGGGVKVDAQNGAAAIMQPRPSDVSDGLAAEEPVVQTGRAGWFREAFRGLDVRALVIKTVLDCFLIGTWGYCLLFVIVMGALKLESPAQIWRDVLNDTWPLVLACYEVWLPIEIVMFIFIPAQKRIVFMAAFGFLWNIFMSLVASGDL